MSQHSSACVCSIQTCSVRSRTRPAVKRFHQNPATFPGTGTIKEHERWPQVGVLAIRQNCTFPFQEHPFQSLGLSYRCFGFASQFQKITLPTDFGARFNTHSFNTSPKTHITGGRQKKQHPTQMHTQTNCVHSKARSLVCLNRNPS